MPQAIARLEDNPEVDRPEAVAFAEPSGEPQASDSAGGQSARRQAGKLETPRRLGPARTPNLRRRGEDRRVHPRHALGQSRCRRRLLREGRGAGVAPGVRSDSVGLEQIGDPEWPTRLSEPPTRSSSATRACRAPSATAPTTAAALGFPSAPWRDASSARAYANVTTGGRRALRRVSRRMTWASSSAAWVRASPARIRLEARPKSRSVACGARTLPKRGMGMNAPISPSGCDPWTSRRCLSVPSTVNNWPPGRRRHRCCGSRRASERSARSRCRLRSALFLPPCPGCRPSPAPALQPPRGSAPLQSNVPDGSPRLGLSS